VASLLDGNAGLLILTLRRFSFEIKFSGTDRLPAGVNRDCHRLMEYQCLASSSSSCIVPFQSSGVLLNRDSVPFIRKGDSGKFSVKVTWGDRVGSHEVNDVHGLALFGPCNPHR
jgi:hypothetical protein